MAAVPPGAGSSSGPSGSYQIVPEVLLNGQAVPATSWSVDVNAYNMASALDATVSTASARAFKALPNFGQLMQQIRPFPFEIKCGYGRGKTAPITLEKGFVDERLTDYANRYITFHGRGTASIFQDIQVTGPINRSQGGSKIVESFFKQHGVPISIAAQSPLNAGSNSGADGDPVYAITMRDRTAWDEMQAIALADGYRLTVHGGTGLYGPPGNDPVITYDWAGAGTRVGLIGLTVRHSPRRSHNVKVIVRGYLPGAKSSVYATYGQASAAAGETFNFAVQGKTRGQVRQLAQSIWYDIAKKEFLITATVVPDEALIRTISLVWGRTSRSSSAARSIRRSRSPTVCGRCA